MTNAPPAAMGFYYTARDCVELLSSACYWKASARTNEVALYEIARRRGGAPRTNAVFGSGASTLHATRCRDPAARHRDPARPSRSAVRSRYVVVADRVAAMSCTYIPYRRDEPNPSPWRLPGGQAGCKYLLRSATTGSRSPAGTERKGRPRFQEGAPVRVSERYRLTVVVA